MWPITRLLNKLPYGNAINWALLVADYNDIYGLNEDILKEWSILDTFDMLSPAYDNPQTIETIEQWFKDTHLSNIYVRYGYNGIEGRGKKR